MSELLRITLSKHILTKIPLTNYHLALFTLFDYTPGTHPELTMQKMNKTVLVVLREKREERDMPRSVRISPLVTEMNAFLCTRKHPKSSRLIGL